MEDNIKLIGGLLTHAVLPHAGAILVGFESWQSRSVILTSHFICLSWFSYL